MNSSVLGGSKVMLPLDNAKLPLTLVEFVATTSRLPPGGPKVMPEVLSVNLKMDW